MSKKDKTKGFFAEFKTFIARGNVLDLAVGVIIGGAFSSITSSLTADVIMPLVSIFLGGIDFSAMKITLPNLFGVVTETPNTLNYGNFINAIINFLIMALVVFCIVKFFNNLHRKKEEPAAPPAPPEPSGEEKLLAEIRDLLKARTGAADSEQGE